ncbi:MAG TPA: hypothetical protein DEA96_13590 [Leptospiraceae bacterium]|nr:hypothetical protein [Spirochaetaceae bacterium]HBS05994.1 hypothetical protein [Leptospiraceae bacterium]
MSFFHHPPDTAQGLSYVLLQCILYRHLYAITVPCILVGPDRRKADAQETEDPVTIILPDN